MLRTFRPIPVASLRLLVWDLDGTLVDSRHDLANALNAALAHAGRPALPLETVVGFVGNGARELVRRALGGDPEEAVLEEALARFLAHYRMNLLVHTRPYPGIPELLEACAARGLASAVLTNKPLEHSEAILEGLGLRRHFLRVGGGDSFPVRKPDPGGALALLADLGIPPAEAMLIGDSDNDSLTARRAGLWSLGVDYGFAPESFATAEPDARVDRVEEIGQLLGLPGATA